MRVRLPAHADTHTAALACLDLDGARRGSLTRRGRQRPRTHPSPPPAGQWAVEDDTPVFISSPPSPGVRRLLARIWTCLCLPPLHYCCSRTFPGLPRQGDGNVPVSVESTQHPSPLLRRDAVSPRALKKRTTRGPGLSFISRSSSSYMPSSTLLLRYSLAMDA